jgi:hypothetical protein
MNRNSARPEYFSDCVSSSLQAIAVLSLLIAAQSASAAPIVYGNFPGATVTYVGVQEESTTDPGSGFFGAPTVAGDTMDFNPQAFAANATNGSSDLTDSNLQFMVAAKPGKQINTVTFQEAGDTNLTGFGGDAFSSVTTSLFIEIAELFGVPTSINVPVAGLSFSPSGGTYQLSVDGAPNPFYATSWNGSVSVNLNTNGVTKVNVSLDNTLSAASQTGTSAFIQKKDADGLIITVDTVPEPNSAVVALACLAVGGRRLRRR